MIAKLPNTIQGCRNVLQDLARQYAGDLPPCPPNDPGNHQYVIRLGMGKMSMQKHFGHWYYWVSLWLTSLHTLIVYSAKMLSTKILNVPE